MKHPDWTLPICHFSFSISDLTLPISHLSLYIAKSFVICYLTNEKCEIENVGSKGLHRLQRGPACQNWKQ